MLVTISQDCQSATSEQRGWARWKKRRGATAMEYLFVASLILVVVMSGISFFGQKVKESAEKSSEALKKTNSSSQQPPP